MCKAFHYCICFIDLRLSEIPLSLKPRNQRQSRLSVYSAKHFYSKSGRNVWIIWLYFSLNLLLASAICSDILATLSNTVCEFLRYALNYMTLWPLPSSSLLVDSLLSISWNIWEYLAEISRLLVLPRLPRLFSTSLLLFLMNSWNSCMTSQLRHRTTGI